MTIAPNQPLNKQTYIMNKIEIAEYITSEFLHKPKKVASIERVNSLEAIIIYSNGERQTVTGKFAVDLLNAPDTHTATSLHL